MIPLKVVPILAAGDTSELELMALRYGALDATLTERAVSGKGVPDELLDGLEEALRDFFRAWKYAPSAVGAGIADSVDEIGSFLIGRSYVFRDAHEGKSAVDRDAGLMIALEQRCGVEAGAFGTAVGEEFVVREQLAKKILAIALG